MLDLIQIQSKACCTRPPVKLSGGYDYTFEEKYVEINGLKNVSNIFFFIIEFFSLRSKSDLIYVWSAYEVKM